VKVLSWQVEKKIPSLDDLQVFVNTELTPRWTGRDLILLKGPLGVGKTQLTRMVAAAMGDASQVASPTYAIHHRYEWGSRSMDHLDLYRLENQEDLESTGFWDLFTQESGLIIVEWAHHFSCDDFPSQWAVWDIEMSFDKIEGGEEKEVRNVGRHLRISKFIESI
jgi:tRNA threonylcarbamoyladenosine biosynthesis protein TsaE